MTIAVRNLLLLLMLACVSACDPPTAPGAGERVGGTGDNAEIRIVALSPAVAVMLRDLGLESEIVGRHGYDIALDPALPVAGDQGGVDYEVLLSLDPTHVFTQFGALGVPERLTQLANDNGWVLEDLTLDSLDAIARTMDDLQLDLIGFEERGVEEFDPTRQFARTSLPSERLAHAWRDRGPAVRDAGRVLMIAAVEPPGVLGPGSFHHELLVRVGGTPAVTQGGPWQELDAEDVLRLAPDAIVIFATDGAPDAGPSGDARFVDPAPPAWGEVEARLGALAGLPIPAVRDRRVALIDDRLALLPSSSLAGVANELAERLEAWSSARVGGP
ncbi:MAG: hypothetical protein RIB60_06630 [Phycisphaerales bacterium]